MNNPPASMSKKETAKSKYLLWIYVAFLLYMFLSAISLMGASFKLVGIDFVKDLFETTSNPLVGLFVGIVATAIIQSSSTTTSLIVGMVSGGVISIEQAIPMIMGANIGTSITNTIVALTNIARKEEFKRAFAGATIHDIFNFLAVLVFFPLEMCTGILAKISLYSAELISGGSAIKFQSPVKIVIKPFVDLILSFFHSTLGLQETTAGVICLILALATIFIVLVALVKALKKIMVSRIRGAMDKVIGENGFAAIIIGFLITALVQSSSVTTSILVPMLGAGVMTLEAAFPITLGANLGTTATALLASLAGDVNGLAIALSHFFFNLAGIAFFYPLQPLRKIPLSIAKYCGEFGARKPKLTIVIVCFVFFVIPIMVILGYRTLTNG